jgi:hypothetical protein
VQRKAQVGGEAQPNPNIAMLLLALTHFVGVRNRSPPTYESLRRDLNFGVLPLPKGGVRSQALRYRIGIFEVRESENNGNEHVPYRRYSPALFQVTM